MTSEEWGIVASMVAIIIFTGTGIPIAYGGYKKWKQVDLIEDKRKKSGKFEFFFGIILVVLAIICVVVLIFLVKNKIIVKPSTPIEPLESIEPLEATELSASDADGRIYVTDQLYQNSTYSGYVNELRQPDGEGTMEYSNGNEYTGDWVNGIRQGKGTMKYDNGIYEGEWKNDKKNGEGTYTWNDGKKYEGAYVDDVRSGEGVFPAGLI